MDSHFTQYQPPKAPAAGFWQQIGLPARGRRLHEVLHEGLEYRVYPRLAQMSGIEQKALAGYVAIPSATLNRRAKSGRFKMAESDRLYRFAELFKATLDLFEGDADGARAWLLDPNIGLGGRRPVEMSATSAEYQTVLNLIGRLEHGVSA
ncbi:antitoxin [Salinicola sp. MH3R3-1]|uniref:type II RES/Xre toxin-antitoxin system antitoxin n=1 Tax=Salinicola sp. MH3R3-1 TaxID=1928762 RepID=UPI00094E558A|nr:antitoxin Xre/MbcA/ParS toxin-binding domain-containing protein [Salinicola sp. MH3R3-1]OLO08373.1 antitoxin [Salinicola sp. MH3R3-1]